MRSVRWVLCHRGATVGIVFVGAPAVAFSGTARSTTWCKTRACTRTIEPIPSASRSVCNEPLLTFLEPERIFDTDNALCRVRLKAPPIVVYEASREVSYIALAKMSRAKGAKRHFGWSTVGVDEDIPHASPHAPRGTKASRHASEQKNPRHAWPSRTPCVVTTPCSNANGC